MPKAMSVTMLANTMTRCLRWRSTMVPNAMENRATSSM